MGVRHFSGGAMMVSADPPALPRERVVVSEPSRFRTGYEELGDEEDSLNEADEDEAEDEAEDEDEGDGDDDNDDDDDDEEERTEPASQWELDARLRRIQAAHSAARVPRSAAVSLEDLQVDDIHHRKGIRILVRDLTDSRSVSPGQDNSVRWLALRAEVASSDQPEHQVLAVTQTHRDIKFTVRIPGELLSRPPLWCELYYDPASDNQILINKSDEPISLVRISKRTTMRSTAGANDEDDMTATVADADAVHSVNPFAVKALSPGTWKITVRDIPVLDFRILERRPFAIATQPMIGKRSFDEYEREGEAGPSDSARQVPHERRDDDRKKKKKKDGVIMFLREKAEPLVFPLPGGSSGRAEGGGEGGEGDGAGADGSGGRQISAFVAQPLLGLEEGQTVIIPAECEMDGYQVTKRELIADSVLSSVYAAEHSGVGNGIITVKVLKTKAPPRPSGGADNERNVIRQADMWLREYQTQDDLEHNSIVRLYGGDARYLSLYMEHVIAKDLSARPGWRGPDDCFSGGRADAIRVLRDITGALGYLHERRLVHNDIKPSNILYSPERGAMLCDFGLSTPVTDPLTTGGTPYYVPPEFIGNRQRGPPSDVWALGVVMLYLLGKISFPEARGHRRHPRQLYWMIADVNRAAPPAPQQQAQGAGAVAEAVAPAVTARMQMQAWLSEIREARGQLDPRDRLERLVAEMLVPNPKTRITMARVRAEMRWGEM